MKAAWIIIVILLLLIIGSIVTMIYSAKKAPITVSLEEVGQHTYLLFEEQLSGQFAVIHDPDCLCHTDIMDIDCICEEQELKKV